MSSEAKIMRQHLEKRAVIYVRQSTKEQVEKNLESQKRQYNLKERALCLGWPEVNCLVIDDDLGMSGAHSANRLGYQKLISMVALGEIGIVFGIEVSRLARNCLDWYQLLEVASTFGVLIGDEDAIYNPADFNDRLLLGLKGTISEVELQQIKSRMYRGRLNKAKRGDLHLQIPVGYEKDLQNNIRLSSNESVREIIGQVFRLYRNLGSVSATLRELARRQLDLPYKKRELKQEFILWRKANYEQIYLILKNPFYAGTYVYGKRSKKFDPINKKHIHITHDPKKWEIVIPNHHEGYISMEEYEDNQKKLRANSFVDRRQVGAVREGSNLLVGIIYCGKCGRRMRSAYAKQKPGYVCNYEIDKYAGERCSYAGAKRIDSRIEELILDVLNDGSVDLTFEMLKTHKQELQNQKTQWQKKVKRLEYEEKLARRRYESVDPENRLVARTLEKEWNANLAKFEDAKREFELQFRNPEKLEVTPAELKSLFKSLPEQWRSGALSVEDKKEIIRCLVEKVVVTRKEESLDVVVYWQGGAVTNLDIKKKLLSHPIVFEKITALAQKMTDEEIANNLNNEAIKTFRGKQWTARSVLSFRIINKIPSTFHRSAQLRLAGSPYVTTPELADMFGLDDASVRTWVKLGFFDVKRGNANKFWVKIDENIVQDFSGTAIKQEKDILLSDLLARQEQSIADIVKWVKSNGHRILRIKEGKGYRFFVRLVQNAQESANLNGGT